MQERLVEEVTALGTRANVNLIIGNAVSIIGLAVLAYFIITLPQDVLISPDHSKFIEFFVTRLSLGAFI
jgi:hypothetical protein